MMKSARPRPLSLVLTTTALLAGLAVAAAYGWLLVRAPSAADQLTALIVITANILLALIHPLAGFLLWLFLAPFAPFLPFDIDMPAGVPDLGFTRVVAGALTLFLLAQMALRRRQLARLTAVDFAIPLFVLALVISGFRSLNGASWGLQSVFDSFLVPLLAYFIARQLIQTRAHFQALAALLMLVAAIIAALAISEQLTGFTLFRVASASTYYGAGIRKVATLLGNPAYIAVTIALVLPLASERLNASTDRRRLLGYATLLLFYLLAIYLTYNRAGWLAGALALVIPAIGLPRFRRLALPALALVAIAGALAWSNLQDTAAAERFGAESPIDYRLQALQTGLQLHRQQPWLGLGWGSFGRIAARSGFRLGANVHVLPTTHNTYLNFLVSGGYLLLGSYLLLSVALLLTLFSLTRIHRRQPILSGLLVAAWASVAAYFLPTATFDSYFAIYTNIVFWALLGGVMGFALVE